ncbi:MAG TPA: tetratricopeptide repeat protein [Candidatus Glassbacteria bacterium]|nr:tetratricopeptide repeat protein [Candidatus Glassbacteria bacterium]
MSAITQETLARARAAADASPRHPGLRYNLGVMLHEASDAAGAAAAYAQATRLKPDFFQAWNNLGLVLEDLNRTDEALGAFRQALVLRPDYPAALKNLGRLSAAAGDVETARDCYRRLGELEPGNWVARVTAALMLPAVPASAEALAAARQRFSTELEALIEQARTPAGTAEQRLNALELHNNFFLPYQGEDDRELQAGYARLTRRLLGDACPELSGPRRPTGTGRLRVGFASCFFRDCTVGHYFRSWITDLDPERFEVWVYLLGGPQDAVTDGINQAGFKTVHVTGPLPEAAQAILEGAPDVLVYPELGMNGRTYALAALRLAPVQCAGWGHPVTSGHATVDYFLSCAAMEPEDGDAHYIESLVRLPGLGTRYAKPSVGTTLSRADLGLPEAAHLYLFPHAPYKVHPENDALLARILADDPEGLLVLCEGIVPEQGRTLRRRLETALAGQGVAPDRLRMLPHLPRASFLEANRLCDVMLDTTRWSGGNTTLDALASGLPVVTRRGRFMRGRQSAGMLEIMGLPELIADNDDDYVAVALRLGRDRVRRDDVSHRIAAARDRLFDDRTPVAKLASFLLSVGQT